jgi:alkylation response protein AidB-like acyl-CoA dehydrogenase
MVRDGLASAIAVTADPVAAAGDLTGRIRGAAASIEQERAIPAALIGELRGAGLFHMVLPTYLGGGGVDPITAARAVEQLAYADGSVGWVVMLAQQSCMFAAFMPEAEARAIWGNGGIVAGTARPIGRAVATTAPTPGYVVSGRWPFASGSSHATWFMGECVVYDGEQPRKDAEGENVTRVTFVPRDAVTVYETWDATGLRGTASNDFSINGAFVPASRGFQMIVDKPIQPWFPLGCEPLLFMNHGSHALGLGRAVLEAANGVMRTKRGWGDAPLSSLARMQTALAEATALVGSARSYLYGTAEELWGRLQTGESPEATALLRARTRLAASHAAKASVQAIDLLHGVLATSSILTSSALERPFRDIHTAAAHVMIGPLTFEAAGRVELGLEPAFPFF